MSEVVIALESSPQLMDAAALQRTTIRLAHEISERHDDVGGVVLAGVRTRGVPLALRLAAALQAIAGPAPRVVSIDARDYRDDRPHAARRGVDAVVAADAGPAPRIHGSTVIVVDDVLFTGRTLRAALDALMDQGRASTIEVLTLIDRGHRELPLRATYVGKNVPTAVGDRVAVRLREIDGMDGAWLVQDTAR